MNRAPVKGGHSPWGTVQTATELSGGCVSVSTAGHGGIWVPAEKLHLIPKEGRAYGARWSHGHGEQWYEEDIAAVFPCYYVLEQRDEATLRCLKTAQECAGMEVEA